MQAHRCKRVCAYRGEISFDSAPLPCPGAAGRSPAHPAGSGARQARRCLGSAAAAAAAAVYGTVRATLGVCSAGCQAGEVLPGICSSSGSSSSSSVKHSQVNTVGVCSAGCQAGEVLLKICSSAGTRHTAHGTQHMAHGPRPRQGSTGGVLSRQEGYHGIAREDVQWQLHAAEPMQSMPRVCLWRREGVQGPKTEVCAQVHHTWQKAHLEVVPSIVADACSFQQPACTHSSTGG